MNIIVNDMLVRYSRQGKGRPIVLLHGWADKLETFDALADQLQGTYEVIRLDLAGFGSSQPPVDAWALDDYAKQVKMFLEKLDIEPYALVGHSNGGAIAITSIASKAVKPTKLVLIASAGIRDDQKLRKQALKVVAKVGKAATLMFQGSARHKLRQRLYGSIGSDLTVSPHMESTFKRIVAEDVLAAAQSITIPTLIVNGSKDSATPPSYAYRFNQAIEKSEVKIIENADHFVHQAHAPDVAELLLDFLA